jgi:hypothetical protein
MALELELELEVVVIVFSIKSIGVSPFVYGHFSAL